MLVHGYHPFAEDGGVYSAGIFLRLNPALFPHTAGFVRAPMRYSSFAWMAAALVRFTHIAPVWMLFFASLFSTWLMLFAARRVLRRCIANDSAQLGGVALLSAWWTLPVAGTSLVLMDPYVTARSFSTPLFLLAVSFALQQWRDGQDKLKPRPLILCCVCLVIAAVMHPLMAAYATALVLTLRVCMRPRALELLLALAFAALIAGGLLQATAPPESAAWLAAEITRYYWFLSQWQWYELLGVIGPLLILGWLSVRIPSSWSASTRALSRACVATGLIAVAVAIAYARENASVHAVARLQPLRVFLFAYAIMAMLLGAFAVHAVQQWASKSPQRRWGSLAPAIFITVMAYVMAYVQRQIYPQSPHVELPYKAAQTTNPWVEAFLWARNNTPTDAFFALPANYITTAGEDAQTFRALALRDALPDYSKDGGEAAIAGSLAETWQRGATAQHDLGSISDNERLRRLRPFGVTWLVLRSADATSFPCPYDNGTIKVCRLTTTGLTE